MVQPHNILIHNAFSLSRSELNLLRSRKIHQIFLHNGLGDLVPGHRSHSISCDASRSADCNVRGSRSDIRQGQIQKTNIFRYGRIDGCNGLQGNAGHLQTNFIHGGVQALHYLAGKKSGDQVHLDIPSPVILQV